MSQVRPGLLIAFIVFAIFAAYAFLAPATYRTSALLVVDSVGPEGSASLPEPLEAARRLGEGVLDRAMLERLSRERAGSAEPEAQAKAASSVRESFTVDTSDAHSFSIGYKDSDPERARRVCNELTRHALARAPVVLAGRKVETKSDLMRQQQTQDLAAFLAQHPQFAAESPVTAGTSPDKDPAVSAFYAEKALLERRLNEHESGNASDNPYVDATSDPKFFRRRLIEINNALNARRTALAAKPVPQQLSPELRAEWKRLLDAVTQPSADPSPQESQPALVARIATEAPLPGAPIDPNRPLLLFFGVVFGVGLSSAFMLVMRAAQQRRTKSSRPPKPSQQLGMTVRLPAAPALPSELRTAVPPTPLPPRNSDSGPPIVPIPLKPISSSPPGPPPPKEGRDTLPLEKGEQPVHKSEIVKVSASEARRPFASTLVLPPPENPTPLEDLTPAPALASAARVWDDQIRAHEVPGFAVVRPRSEPPPVVDKRTSSSPPAADKRPSSSPPAADKRSSSSPPADAERRASAAPSAGPRTVRPHNQMKVTQPLGSFLPDGGWNDPSPGLARGERAAQPTQAAPTPPIPRRSPIPQLGASYAPEGSSYSYVSSRPPSDENNVAIVRPAPEGWSPDESLDPRARVGICEQLYPLAVANCFVVLVVGVPGAAEQKSRVAAELALALAASGHPRILFLDADLQGPRVHRLLRVDMPIAVGFSQQLRARINGSAETRWTVVGCSKSLHVLAEGMMRSPGLLLSQQFADSLREFSQYYDFIVIDGPTSSLDVESQALDAATGGVVFVAGQDSNALEQLQRLFRNKRFQTVVTLP